MKKPNGYGTIKKLSGNRRRPFPIQFIKSAIIPLVSINYKRLGSNRAQTSNDFSIGTADVSTNNFRITLEAFSNSYDPTNALVYWLVVGR